jgi:hypothetical protein
MRKIRCCRARPRPVLQSPAAAAVYGGGGYWIDENGRLAAVSVLVALAPCTGA